MKHNLKLGLALGGGSARAAAHIGALKVLENYGFRPSILSGTSSGAFIAAVYALGYSAQELEEIFLNFRTKEFWRQGLDFAPDQFSLIRGKRMMDYLNKNYLKDALLEDLEIPLQIATVDLETTELVVLKKGLAAKAVMASSSLPGIFAATLLEQRWLIDGGFLATVPFVVLENYDLDLIIGIHAGIDSTNSLEIKLLKSSSPITSHFFETASSVLPNGSLKRLTRAYQIVFASYNQELIAPKNGILVNTKPSINWWDFHKMPIAIADGERAMLKALRESDLI